MANNRNTGPTDDTGAIIVIGAVLVFFVLGWYVVQPYFANAWIFYAKIETYALLATTPVEDVRYQAHKLLEWLDTATPEMVDERMYVGARRTILSKGWHNYIIMAFILFMAVKVYIKNNRYRGIPSIHSLLKTESKVWPTLEFIKRFDPFVHWSEIKGPGRYMVSPFVFAVEEKFLKNYTAKSKKDRIFDDEAAEQAFTRILGDPFVSFSDLSAPMKALIVIVAAKDLEERYPHYNELVRWLAIVMADVKNKEKTLRLVDEFCTPVMALLDGKDAELNGNALIDDLVKSLISDDKAIKKIRETEKYALTVSTIEFLESLPKKHAFINTLAIGAARTVKRRGKFPPGRLVFFKPWDRRLFLILSNTPYYIPDSESPYRFVSGFSAEVLPIFNHYQFEVYAGRRLEKPNFKNGIESIKLDLQQQNLIQ